jgi:hypothetical protein
MLSMNLMNLSGNQQKRNININSAQINAYLNRPLQSSNNGINSNRFGSMIQQIRNSKSGCGSCGK